MKVSELIERLKAMPQDLEVVMYCDWCSSVKDVYVEDEHRGKRVVLNEEVAKESAA